MPGFPTLEEADLQAAVMEAISRQYLHKDADMETTLQSIRAVLTPETADSEYVLRTRINDLQKERKSLIAKALEENDDGKYDFQFARIKQELRNSKPNWRGCRLFKSLPPPTAPGWRRSPPCWRSSRRAACNSMTSWCAR